MQITVTIPDDFAAEVLARGLTPVGYVEKLIAEQAGTALLSMEPEARLADLEKFMEEMAAHSDKIPLLSDESLTRESFYQDHA